MCKVSAYKNTNIHIDTPMNGIKIHSVSSHTHLGLILAANITWSLIKVVSVKTKVPVSDRTDQFILCQFRIRRYSLKDHRCSKSYVKSHACSCSLSLKHHTIMSSIVKKTISTFWQKYWSNALMERSFGDNIIKMFQWKKTKQRSSDNIGIAFFLTQILTLFHCWNLTFKQSSNLMTLKL